VRAGPDVGPWAEYRVADQRALADPQVRRPNRLLLLIAMGMAVRLAQQAWDASVGPDAVRLVFDLQVRKEAVRDFPQLASGDVLEVPAAHPPHGRPKLPPVASPMVAGAFLIQFRVQDVAQKFPPQAAEPEPPPEWKQEPQVAHSALPDE
jgi:hypothetical protein